MKLWVVGIVLLCGCVAAPLMRDSGFDAVGVGSNISDIEAVYGEPFEVRSQSNGTQEYVYIQRINCGSSSVEMTEYVFTVRQGTIVGKCRREHSTPSVGICQ